LALRDGHLELLFEELGQYLLCEGRVLSLLLPQPSSPLSRRFVRMTVAMVDECFPGRPSLAIATAQLGKVVPTVRKS
jgi:hypothetical protein